MAEQMTEQDTRADKAAVEQAIAWLTEHDSLVRQGHLQEARELLYQCRDTFDRAGDDAMTAEVLTALADVDARLGHLNRSVEQEIEALTLRYRLADAEAIAASHHNLAGYLILGEQDPRAVWAHGLAAAVIHYQINSPRSTTSVEAIGRFVGRGSGGTAAAPSSFADVCQMVDRLPGVRFAELFAQLPARAADGQAAIDEIMRRTTELRDSAIAESVAAWEPIISAMVVADRERCGDVARALEQTLDELSSELAWNELVMVLRRIQAGPNYHSDHTVEDLDPVSAAVAIRARSAMAGDLVVDPTAWRALLDET